MAEIVLDASAVLAIIGEEPGAERVASVISTAVIGAVNLAEVISTLSADDLQSELKRQMVYTLPLFVEPLDEALAIEVGLLRRSTAHRGLSLGDRACLALARRDGLPVLTADRVWADLDIGVEIRLIR